MATRTLDEILFSLIAATYRRQVVEITYYPPTPSAIMRRIEPYSIIDVGSGRMLKAYQIAPNPGWRLFNTALIGTLRETGETFDSRRPLVMDSGGERKHIAPVERQNAEQVEYANLLQGCIVDMTIDPEEARKLAQFRKEYGLSPEEVRGVHFKVLADCLTAVTQDCIVFDEENQLLIDLNKCLQKCGAGLMS